MKIKTTILLLALMSAGRCAADPSTLGVFQGQQAANYYYGALAPLDFFAPPVTPRLVNGNPYNGQFAVNPASSYGNPSGIFPTYGGPANNYYGGPGSNGMMPPGRFPPGQFPPGPNPPGPNPPGPDPNQCALDRNSANGFSTNLILYTCPCSNVWNPVCSNNGVTYANYCRAVCHGASNVTQGACFTFNSVPTCNRTCSCQDTTSLVCGNDGATYENSCVANCAGVSLVSTTRCPFPCNCQYYFAPVCSRTGRNYVNLCFLNCAQEQLLFNGPCDKFNNNTNPCSACDNNYNPVCGADGVTYQNQCQLNCQNKTTIRFNGQCPTYVNGTCVCPTIYLPVCSSDGRTFGNYCQLFCANATFAYQGQCISPNGNGGNGYNPNCLQNCASQGWKPVCGTDGISYGNQCALTCKLSGAVNPIRSGPCNPIVNSFCQCASDINLVCGADGKTYLNPCQLNCVSVNQQAVGPCPAIGNYGSVLSWFQQYGIGSNYVDPNGYSILQDPHIFITGPFGPQAGNGPVRRDGDSSGRRRRPSRRPVRPVRPVKPVIVAPQDPPCDDDKKSGYPNGGNSNLVLIGSKH